MASLVCAAVLNDDIRKRLEDLARYTVSAGLRTSQEYAEQNPLRVIAGIAGTGFLLGVFLRARKKNRG